MSILMENEIRKSLLSLRFLPFAFLIVGLRSEHADAVILQKNAAFTKTGHVYQNTIQTNKTDLDQITVSEKRKIINSGGGDGGGGGYGWAWGGGGGGGGGGRGGGGGGGGGGGWGWGGGGGGYSRWGHTNQGRKRHHLPVKRGHDQRNGDFIKGEFGECMVRGRCLGMRLDCPLHCGGPCFYDCRHMCKAHCRK